MSRSDYDSRGSQTRLYVGRLSSRTRTRDLEDLFLKYGRIRDVDLKHDYAFIEFYDSRDADDARHYLNGKEVDGSRLIVEFTRRQGPRGPRGTREYLGRGPPPGTGRCYNCGKDGHWARDCRAGDWREKCYRCGRNGHIERNCRYSPRGKFLEARSVSRSRSPRGRSYSRSPSRGRSRSRSYSRSRSPERRDSRRSPDRRYSRSPSPDVKRSRRSVSDHELEDARSPPRNTGKRADYDDEDYDRKREKDGGEREERVEREEREEGEEREEREERGERKEKEKREEKGSERQDDEERDDEEDGEDRPREYSIPREGNGKRDKGDDSGEEYTGKEDDKGREVEREREGGEEEEDVGVKGDDDDDLKE